MVVAMIFASVYGILQLALLSLPTRSVRASTVLLAVAVGCYGCGVTAVVAEIAYTRLVHLATGRPLAEVVATASFTVDPFIEEIVKIAPLVLVVWLCRRYRTQWGLTDFLVLGAAVGTGFALVEALLRYSGSASRATSDGHGGFLILRSLYPPHVHGVAATVTGWLPPPVDTLDLFGAAGADVNLHLVWTALAGLGIGLVVRLPGWRRLLGLLPLLYASVDHAANNYAITASPDGFFGVVLDGLGVLRDALPVVVLLGLAAAVVLDVLVLRRARRTHPALLIAAEAAGRPGLGALGGFALLAPPWTAVVAMRFALVRRSAWYALASRSTDPPPVLAAEVHELARQIDSAGDRRQWLRAAADLGLVLASPRRLLRQWPVLVWLVLSLPVLAYFVLGAVPATSGLQQLMRTGPVFWLVGAIVVLGLGYGLWQLVRAVRLLPRQARQPWGEGLLRATFRVLIGACAVSAGMALVLRWWTGGPGDQAVITNSHVLDALGSLLLLTALLLALAALFIFFPPGGALVVAGGGTIAGTGALTLAGVMEVAGVLGLSGIVLMAASRGGGGGGYQNTPGNNQAQNKQARGARQEAERRLGRRLSKAEWRRVHDEITGQDYSYQEIVELIVDMFG